MGSSPIFRAINCENRQIGIGNYLYVLFWKVGVAGACALDWKSKRPGPIPGPSSYCGQGIEYPSKSIAAMSL